MPLEPHPPSALEQRIYPIIDLTLDGADLEYLAPLDNGRHAGIPQYPAGLVDTLPLENITQVLLQLDLVSLTALRRANRRAMELVDSLYEYTRLVVHCPNVIRVILAIDARSFSCATLFDKLSTNQCETCDGPGTYLYLLTCKRVCYSCFSRHPDYLPMPSKLTAKLVGRPVHELNHLPHIRSVPGQFTTAWARLSGYTFMMFDRQAVLQMAPPETAMEILNGIRPLRDETTRDARRYMAIISFPSFTDDTRNKAAVPLPGPCFRLMKAPMVVAAEIGTEPVCCF